MEKSVLVYSSQCNCLEQQHNSNNNIDTNPWPKVLPRHDISHLPTVDKWLATRLVLQVSEAIDDKITEDDYNEILDINAGNDVTINGQTIKAADLMEAFYELFVAWH